MVDEIKATGLNFRTNPVGRLGSTVRESKSAAAEKMEVTDRVEISELATWLGRYTDLPVIRTELVSKIKEQVQAGTYETPAKLDQALDNLLDDLEL